MSSTQYQRGVRKERAVMDEYRSKGWHVMRTAGSHGMFDVIAIEPDWDEVHFIQVKYAEKAPTKNPVKGWQGVEMNVYTRTKVRVYVKGDGFVEYGTS